MATDLFSKYYNNPTKSYIYADILCSNGDSGDEISFDFGDGSGDITDNDDVLSSIDLKDIHVGLSEYTSDRKIIEPNSYCYIRGWYFGDSYCSKSFGRVIGPITEEDDWMYKVMLFFVIKYLDLKTGNKKTEILKVTGNLSEDITFLDAVNTYFEEKEIPITVTFDDGYVVFTATRLDYEFWVDRVLMWKSEDGEDILYYINEWMAENGHSYNYGWSDNYVIGNNIDSSSLGAINVYSSILKKSDYSRLYNLLDCLDSDFNSILEEHDVKKIYLYEDFTRYVPSRRYRNGAMLGVFLNVVYPQYNTDEIDTLQKAVRVAHVGDRVQEFYAIPDSLMDGTFVGVRKLIDVNDLFHCEHDRDSYNKWMGFFSHNNVYDDWIESDEIPEVMPEMIDRWANPNKPCGCSNNSMYWNDPDNPEPTPPTPPTEDSSNWIDSQVSYTVQGESIRRNLECRDQMGLEGYCAYLTKTNQWMTVGQFYGRTSIPDDPNYPRVKNMIPSLIIYNPNPFPVLVKYLAFV